MNISFRIKYEVNGKQFTADSFQNEHFNLIVKNSGSKLKVSIRPKTDISINDFTIKYPYKFKSDDRIYVNGYQSWTDSFEYTTDGRMRELSKFAEFLFSRSPLRFIGNIRSGDTLFHKYPRQNGIFYGWSYVYVRNGNNIDLFGSLNERCGYTVITLDTNKDVIYIGKELEGVIFKDETELLDLTVISDVYDNAFDRYFEEMGVQCREKKKRVGYTTWYNYYSNINEKVVLRDLNSISKLDIKIDCFQIDDGHQTNIGDWLQTDKKKFPNGMKNVADNIHKNGMLAGLWLAPFAATRSSDLFKEHKDWFIKDKNGKPYKTGHNWGGFYSLDIYNPNAREYIKKVFDTVLNEWGYDLVKLDFLYGACVLPMHNRSRGEIMCDAMDLLRECCADKLILGCGVPLMPAFGKVDYCRIGSDTSLSWKPKKHATREDVSLPHAVCNTVFRRHLDGRAWMNDPDVFILRDKNNKIDFEKRKLFAKINSLFGSLLFISDNVDEYNAEQLKVLKDAFSPKSVKIYRAEFVQDNIMEIDYNENGKDETLKFNVLSGKQFN